ncbi:MAG: hypothetical protein QOI74_3180 [Micromonosporaceae bacterium]|nr:hypothetical protein [Micromonosporaceae bacterium]
MPTSVLLAVLAAAGLLALAPALVRRYDATERLVAERALSTARVLARAGFQTHRRRRTVPGRRPVNPPRVEAARMTAGTPVAPPPTPVASPTSPARNRTPRRLPHARAVYRRRRVFAALVLLNVVELVGVGLVGPGFWISAAVTGAMLAGYLVHLRNRALLEQRRHRAAARYAAWVAARQAAVRREQARRLAARRELLRQQLLEREQTRREAARSAARSAVRGRPYEARAVGQDW